MAEKNERKICDAVARVLEARSGITRSGARTPERDRQGPPVEYRFELGEDSYAFEHTIIEAFDRQIHSGVDFDAMVGRVSEQIGQTLPKPGVYYVTFPLHASDLVKRKDISAFQTAMIGWVRDAAARLYARQMRLNDGERGQDFDLRETPPGMPFETLMRRSLFPDIPPKANGRLFIGRLAPRDPEELREKRIQRALDKKCPKLRQCKEEGAKSILILEDNDIALSNHILIGDSLRALLQGRDDLPDEIFLVDTCIEDWWTVCSLFRDGMFWPDGETATRYREVDPKVLDEV